MPTEALILLLTVGTLGLAVLATLVAAFFTVEQRTTAIVQRLGKFVGEAGPSVHVLMTQYFDMLKEIGASSRTNAILIPHSPGNLASLSEQMRTAMIEADQTVHPAAAARHVCGNGGVPSGADNSRTRDAS